MLKSDHCIANFDFDRRTVQPDRLRRGRDDHYADAARWMLHLYRQGGGQTRGWLHQRVEQHLSLLGDCPPRRIAAFCKLLDDFAEYHRGGKAASDLRRRVFTAAAELHPIVSVPEGIFENSIHSARTRVSEQVGRPWHEIETQLFADVIELQTLSGFETSLEPIDLLSLYNVSQTQAVMYRAMRMRIDASEDLKTILRHAKLAGLMHRISRIGNAERPRYRFDFDGPQSTLRTTTRYGVRFARMLPKLLACRGWQLTAWVAGPDRCPFVMRVSPADRLRSPLVSPDEFDSDLEKQVFDTWQKSPISGWTMERESELLHCGQTVLTPDFVLRHPASGRMIYVELVGYWTPEYLAEKAERLVQFAGPASATNHHRWLLLFPRGGEASQRQLLETLKIPSLIIGRRMNPQQWIDAAMD